MSSIEYMEEDILIPRLENIAFELINKLKSDQIEYKVDALNKLDLIATALGVERTRTKLIPYLTDYKCEDENVLILLVDQLARLINKVGGSSYVHVLLAPLESIASVVKYVTIRDKVVESIIQIIQLLPKGQFIDYVFPLLKRLSRSKLGTGRCSAIGIIPFIYSLSDEIQQNDLRILFTDLVNDSDLMVRNTAFQILPDFFIKLKPKEMKSGYKWFEKLSRDKEECVRTNSINSLICLSDRMKLEQRKQYLIPIIERLSQDTSWQVKQNLAIKFNTLSESIQHPLSLIIPFQHLIASSEKKVKVTMVTQLVAFSSQFVLLEYPETMTTAIIPAVALFVMDKDKEIREMISNEMIGMATLLGNEQTTMHLLPLFSKLFRDDDVRVKLNMMSQLEILHKVIGKQFVSENMLPAFNELSKDKDWYIRNRMIEYIPFLAKEYGELFFHEQLFKQYILWLHDPVFSIRKAAAMNFKHLAVIFESDWIKKHVIPGLNELAVDLDSYKKRLTALFGFSAIAEVLSVNDVVESIVPVLLQLTYDPVPNIRFNAIQSIELLHVKTSMIYKSKIQPVLEELIENDKDKDVQFHAKRAMESFSHWRRRRRPNL
ncbi:armadillo-type protein [Pilaira anomala]|nr:armadillo-type protein [Pilaira anomala]